MNPKSFTKLSRRQPARWLTKMLFLAAIFVLLVPHPIAGGARASAGDLASEFGSGGKITTDFFRNFDTASAVAAYPDGKILVAGSSRVPNTFSLIDIALARYDPDGSLDQTFGNGGLVTTDFNAIEVASAVAIQPDGKIVVVATISRSVGHNDFAVIRYNQDGSLDSSLGQGGLVTTDFYNTNDNAADLAITPNGEIVVAGTINWSTTSLNTDFALARYDRTGNLDLTFGSGGKVTADFGSIHDFASAMALNSNGEIVLAGHTTTFLGVGLTNIDFALACFNRNGSPDVSFGVGGRVTTDFRELDMLGDVSVTPNGKIIAAGTIRPSVAGGDFVLARYNRDGSLDQSFGADGSVITDFSVRDDSAFSIAVRPNGKIIVAGRTSTNREPRTFEDFALARYERDGSLDQSFGSGGLVITDFSGNVDEARAVAILRSGRIIAAGQTWDAKNQPFSQSIDFALVEYEWR